MAGSCSLYAQVINANGEAVDSKLFKDLLSYTSNDRQLAKELYSVALSEEVLNKAGSKISYDENGEPTLKSLLEITKTKIDEDRIIQMCNNEIGAGNYDYQDAILKLQNFNKNSEWSNRFLATISPTSNGKYALSVVKRSNSAESTLNDVIANQTIMNRIINALASHGIAVDFLTDGGTSRYSTENAEKAADGFYHLIQIAHGEKVDEALAEEAGHAAVAALGNSPLVQRLESILTPDVQKDILGDEYDRKFMGRNSAREVSGVLVGRALNGGIDKQTVWGRLANRIADLAKRVFYKMTGNQVRLNKLEALQIADKIARGFMSGEGSIENALSREETLYDVEYSKTVQTYKKVRALLKTTAAELKAANSDLADVVTAFVAIMENSEFGSREKITNTQMGNLVDLRALEGITIAVDYLLDELVEEVPKIIDSVKFNDGADFAQNVARNGKSLREAHILLKRCLEISEVVSLAINTTVNGITTANGVDNILLTDPSSGRKVTKNLRQMSAKLSSLTSANGDSLYSRLFSKEVEFFGRFCESIYGAKYVDRGMQALFNWKNWGERGKHLIEFKNKKITIKQCLDNLESDISIFDRYLGSMSNSSDIISQIVDKGVKQTKKQADDITEAYWQKLKILEAKMHELGIKDPEVFYERTDEGRLTGNLIGEAHWGKWEEKYSDMKRAARKAFEDAHRKPDGTFDYDDKTDFEKAFIWEQYFNDEVKHWHESNSEFDRTAERYVPRMKDAFGNDTEYVNQEYKKLSDGAKKWLSDLMAIKIELDQLCGDAMPNHRAPQFKGTLMNRVRNRGSRLNPKSYSKGFGELFMETFCVDSEDTDYGSLLTYNSDDEAMFEDALANEKEKINRLPLFGINRISDNVNAKAISERMRANGASEDEINKEIKARRQNSMDRLSTDVFHSMLAYANMAAHYASMSIITDILEVGSNILEKRSVGRISSESSVSGNKSRAYNRYLKYLDKQVYSISQRPIVIGGKVVLNKIANFLSSLAAKVYLGGNIPGGIVNLGTGVLELFKEGVAGEYFNMEDWAFAHKYYFSHLVPNMLEIGKTDADSYLALFLRKFNTRGNNKQDYAGWSTYHSRAFNFLYNDSLLLPYAAGDHYMQAISYLALAHKKKLIKEDGTEVKLWDAYKRVITKDASNKENKEYGHELTLDGLFFENEEDRQEYMMMRSIVKEIEASFNQSAAMGLNPGSVVIDLNPEQEKYLKEKDYDIEKNPKLVYDTLKIDMLNTAWGTSKESTFMDEAREINDRLHGIYNDLDKTAFHQNIYTNMVLAMRGYALGMIQRRFGTNKYSTVLNSNVEGTFTTFAKTIMACSTDNWGFGKTVLAVMMPFGPWTKRNMLNAGFSESQYRNMRRFCMDNSLIIILTLLKALTAQKDDDDDSEREQYYAMLRKQGVSKDVIKQMKDADRAEKMEGNIDMVGICNYFFTRLDREQNAFNTPWGIYNEWGTLGSTTPVGLSILADFASIVKNTYGASVYDFEEYDAEYFKMLEDSGMPKEQVSELRKQRKEEIKNAPGQEYFYKQNGPYYNAGDSKAKIKVLGMVPYYKGKKVWYHPYDAVKSYDYGKRIRN